MATIEFYIKKATPANHLRIKWFLINVRNYAETSLLKFEKSSASCTGGKVEEMLQLGTKLYISIQSSLFLLVQAQQSCVQSPLLSNYHSSSKPSFSIKIYEPLACKAITATI